MKLKSLLKVAGLGLYAVAVCTAACAGTHDAVTRRSEAYLLRTDSQKNTYEALEVSYEASAALEVTTRVVRRKIYEGTPHSDLLQISGDPDAFHFSFIEPDLDFVIPRYDRRGWGEAFPEKLRALAKQYLQDSIYVTVFDPHEQRLGSIRFIRQEHRQHRDSSGVEVFTPHAKLPEARYLGITLPLRQAHNPIRDEQGDIVAYDDESIEWEVGNFAVDEKQPAQIRSRVLSEIWIQFMRVAFDGSWRNNLVGTSFHAYADESSKKLYLPLGFQFLDDYEIDGKKPELDANREPFPIVKDGINWWPIVFYPEQIMSFNDRASRSGFRAFDADLLRARREENVTRLRYEADSLAGISGLLKNLGDRDQRMAETSMGAILQLFRAADIYNDAVGAAVPSMDYGSDFNNDPMMQGYRTYCDLLEPLMCMTEQLIDVVLPQLYRLASDRHDRVARQRARRLLAEIHKVGFFSRSQLVKSRERGPVVEDPLATRFAGLLAKSAQSAPHLAVHPTDSSKWVDAVFQIVESMKRERFSALVLSGESAILSYSLIKAAWDRVGGPGTFPAVFVIGREMNDTLKSLSGAPTPVAARLMLETGMPALRSYGANVLVLDDHAYTGIKYARMQDFFYRAGLLNVTFGFMAIHPDSIARRVQNLGYESAEFVERFREVGQVLHSDPQAAERTIVEMIGVLRKVPENSRTGAASTESDTACRAVFGSPSFEKLHPLGFGKRG